MKIHSGPVKLAADSSANDLNIIGVICEGRAFRVYKAQSGTKFVTLKAPVSSDAMSVELLRREYEMSVSLSHPCIVSTTGFKEDSPVGPAIVMEFIDGLTLDEFVAHGATSAQRRSVLKDILDGVDYLHHRGVLHNDLKPDNIIINSNGAARIIDFGLSGSDDSAYKGCAGGTGGYSAPEIIKGDGTAGATSDIYSIGLLIRLLFGGRRYRFIAAKCSRSVPQRRFRSVDEVRKALSRINALPPAVTVFAAVAVIAAVSLSPKVQEVRNESRVYSLEEQYEAAFASRFDDAVARMKQQKYREPAEAIAQEYFDNYSRFIDSLTKAHPMSDTGEIAPEIFAATAVFRRQLARTDSVKLSLPSMKKLPAK